MSGTVRFSKLELDVMLKVMRAQTLQLEENKLHLEERKAGIGDGIVEAAILTAENELYILRAIKAKLWILLLSS